MSVVWYEVRLTAPPSSGMTTEEYRQTDGFRDAQSRLVEALRVPDDALMERYGLTGRIVDFMRRPYGLSVACMADDE